MLGLLKAAPAWARGAMGGTLARRGSDVLAGEHMTMTVADASFATGSRHGPAVTINGTLPGRSMQSDWSPMHPHKIMRKLRVGQTNFNYD